MAGITSLLMVVAISLLITRVATVLLTATGMSAQAARFQARSAFTGAGFTTSESEDVMIHPLRRRVVMLLMLLGHIGIVAAAGTLILGFNSGGLAAEGYRTLELVLGLLVLVFLSTNRWVDRNLNSLIRRVIHDYTDLPTRDLDSLLELSGRYTVAELAIEDGDWMAGRPLDELDLRDEGIAVLGVTRADGRYRGNPVGSTAVFAGDSLVLYGLSDDLDALDRRPAGPVGDAQHAAAVERQRLLVGEEDLADAEDRREEAAPLHRERPGRAEASF